MCGNIWCDPVIMTPSLPGIRPSGCNAGLCNVHSNIVITPRQGSWPSQHRIHLSSLRFINTINITQPPVQVYLMTHGRHITGSLLNLSSILSVSVLATLSWMESSWPRSCVSLSLSFSTCCLSELSHAEG